MNKSRLFDTHRSAEWLENVTNRDEFRCTIARARTLLHDIDFDSIAFCGISGALFGPTLAHAMGKEIILVRKKDDTSHSNYTVEGFRDSQRYIFVDDIIDYGRTFRHTVNGVKRFAPNAKLIGVYLYGDGRSTFLGELLRQWIPVEDPAIQLRLAENYPNSIPNPEPVESPSTSVPLTSEDPAGILKVESEDE